MTDFKKPVDKNKKRCYNVIGFRKPERKRSMKKNELEKINFIKLYNEFMDNMRGYIGKENTKKMFYANLYLIYLAKKNKIDLLELFKCHAFDPATNLSERKGINKILDRLIYIYSKSNVYTNELEILEDIKSLFETNSFNEEINPKLSSQIIDLTEEDIKQILVENTLEIMNYSTKDNDASSKEIIDLVSHCLDIKEKNDVLDLCSGSGNFLVSLVNKNLKLSGVEINRDNVLISKIRLAVLNDVNIEIVNGDALTYRFTRKYDKIFCEFPLGLRVNEFILNQMGKDLFYTWNKPGLTAEWMFINKIVTILKNEGKAAIIVPDGPLFKSMDANYRRDLLVSGVVQYIIKLPSGIIPNTNISANLIVLSRHNEKNEIKFIDASQEYIENKLGKKQLHVRAIMDLIDGKNNDEDKVKIEKTSEICKTEDVLLTVNSYVKKKEPNYINPHFLKEYIIDKYRGYQLTSKEQAEITDKNGNYELLTISDIDDGKISNNLLKICDNNSKYDRYLLKDGDVVVSARGTKIKVAVAEIKNRKIIPNGNLLVLRLNTEKINPYYLQAYLNSENGQLSLEQIQTGAIIMSINPSRIEQMKVSMVDKETQDIFVEKYKRKLMELYLAQEHVKKLKYQIDNFFTNEIEENENNG